MIIYLLQNTVNNKVYIGQHWGTSLRTRWHTNLNNVNKVNTHLTNAIAKYGAESFSRDILCHATNQRDLDLLEQFFIAAYRSADPRYGYNKQLGGRTWCGPFTEELRRRIGEGIKKAWERKSRTERWEASFTAKIKWLMMTEEERHRIMTNVRKGQAGRPSARKGKVNGPQANPCRERKPFTREHKDAISRSLKRYFAGRRKKGSGSETATEGRHAKAG